MQGLVLGIFRARVILEPQAKGGIIGIHQRLF